MLRDSERYILTTARASVIRNVLSFVLAKVGSESDAMRAPFPSPGTDAMDGCDRMILELRRPREVAGSILPAVRNLRTSRLGRVLVVTGEATAPEILKEIDAIRRTRFHPQHLTSPLVAFGRTLFCTLRLADHHN